MNGGGGNQGVGAPSPSASQPEALPEAPWPHKGRLLKRERPPPELVLARNAELRLAGLHVVHMRDTHCGLACIPANKTWVCQLCGGRFSASKLHKIGEYWGAVGGTINPKTSAWCWDG